MKQKQKRMKKSKVDENTENKAEEEETKVAQELTVVTSSGKNSTYELKNTDAFTLKLVASKVTMGWCYE